MGGETRSKSGFRQGMTKTHISNPCFASSEIKQSGNSLAVHWIQLCSPTAQGTDYIPGWGFKVPIPKKKRIKWGKPNLLLRMSVNLKKEKLRGKDP